MYFDADGGPDATSGFVGLGVGHMFGERGSCVVPLDFLQGIASDLTFIEQQVTKTLNSLAAPTSTSALYPVSGGDSGTWTTTTPSDNALGWTSGFFPGELWLLSQATTGQQQQWLTAAEQWTAPLASQASNVLTGGPH